MIEFEYCSSIAGNLEGGVVEQLGGSIWVLVVILVGFGVVCLWGPIKIT